MDRTDGETRLFLCPLTTLLAGYNEVCRFVMVRLYRIDYCIGVLSHHYWFHFHVTILQVLRVLMPMMTCMDGNLPVLSHGYPDSKVYGTNMGPTWVLSAPDGPHVGPMNLAIRVYKPDQDRTLSFIIGFLNGDVKAPEQLNYQVMMCRKDQLGAP